MPRSVTKALCTWIAVIASAPLCAGTLSLAWQPATNAGGYRVYYGLQSGAYDQSVDVGPVTAATITGLQDCRDYFLAVKAYNRAGESPAYSNEITGWARPALATSSPSAGMQGDALVLDLPGANFRPGAVVAIDNPRVHVGTAIVLDCYHIDVSLSVDPPGSGLRAAQIGAFTLSVSNADGTFGDLVDGFEVLINPARFDVNQSRPSTAGRIDGEDTVWMARLFASRETDALYDNDFDLDGNGWVDGQDLSYLASNLGRCWNGSTWTIDACAGRHG